MFIINATKTHIAVAILFNHIRSEKTGLSNVTICDICTVNKDRTAGKQLSRGLTQCHPNDSFSRKTGRKKSLLDAVADFDRPSRKSILTGFFAVRKGVGNF